MAVEWVRSCFQGKWRLFRGHPEILTPGRYVRCRVNQPHYIGWHNLGSRDWTSDERLPWPDLGESEEPRKWFGGTTPNPYPIGDIVGTPNCLQFGEMWPLPIATQLIDGYPTGCWDGPPVGLPPTFPILSVFDRPTATQLAFVSDVLYSSPAAAAAMLQTLLGPGTVVTAVANSASVVPGSLVAVSPTQTVVVISGTTTPEQRSLQWLNAIGGITDYTGFATLTVWYDSAVAIAARMTTAAVPLNKPITIVGHSYGGAVTQVLAGIVGQANPTADIRLLTFGAPRPGDGNLIRSIARYPQVNWANVGDPVPSLPPTGAEANGYFLVTPPLLYFRWNRVGRPWNPVLLSSLGIATAGHSSPLDSGLVYAAVLAAIAGTPQPDYPAHDIKEYVRRLTLFP